MEYRKLPKGGEEISVIGIGSSSIGLAGEKEVAETFSAAIENGINYFVRASGVAGPFSA